MSEKTDCDRIIGRIIATPLDYSIYFSDPEAARGGEVDLSDIAAKSTCTGGNDEDED